MIRTQTFRDGLWMFVQGDQNVRRQREKFFRIEIIFQQSRKCFVAEIFQQQKAVFVVARENSRRAETEFIANAD